MSLIQRIFFYIYRKCCSFRPIYPDHLLGYIVYKMHGKTAPSSLLWQQKGRRLRCNKTVSIKLIPYLFYLVFHHKRFDKNRILSTSTSLHEAHLWNSGFKINKFSLIHRQVQTMMYWPSQLVKRQQVWHCVISDTLLSSCSGRVTYRCAGKIKLAIFQLYQLQY